MSDRWYIETNNGRKIAGPYMRKDDAINVVFEHFHNSRGLFVVGYEGPHPDELDKFQAWQSAHDQSA